MAKKGIAITIVIFLTVITLILGPKLWPSIEGEVGPTSAQIPFLITLSIIESLLFGIGIALIYIAIPQLKKVKEEERRRTYWTFASIIWILISWWPHDNLHRHVGMNYSALIGIEYGFHLTIMLAGIMIAYYFMKEIKE
ncbi:MAG: hypothetical protein AABW73_01575 [Nanoarchaeota archaeon]